MLNKFNNNQGFTLIELLVSMTIMLTVIYISMDYLVLGFKGARFADEQREAIAIARDSMSTIIKEIRGANTSEQGDYPLRTTEDEDIIFFSDIDNDDEFEKIRYVASTTVLLRIVTEPGAASDYNEPGATTTVAKYLNNDDESIFTYFDEEYNETMVINQIRLIKINLKINVTPEIAPNDVFVESDVNLRNLKDNL